MIASNLPPAVHATGDITAVTDKWAVTTDVDVKHIYPTLPNGDTIRVTHITHIVTCHSLITGARIVFRRAKKNWHDSRRAAPRMRRKAWFRPPSEDGHDFKDNTISRFDVVKEIARLGAGDKAQAIVNWAERRSITPFQG